MEATTLVLMPAIPEIFLACAGMALLMVGVFIGDRSLRLVSWLAVGSFVITAALLYVFTGWGGRELAFGGLFVADSFALFAKLFILLGSAVAIILSMDYLEREHTVRFEYPILILFATLGMMMMVSANSLISLYVGLELQSLALYVLAAIRRDTIRSTEAGLKYFVLGALSSGMLLYGSSMIYGFTGSVDFTVLANSLAGDEVSVGLIVGIVFLSVGLAFKVSAVPFHMWTPDVYEGAPTPVTALFASAPKFAAVVLFCRVMVEPFGNIVDQWQQIIVLISIGSMVLGALAAINQTNIKRLMAYSSIGHMGYALIGLAAGSEIGIRGVLIYMAIYIVMNLGTFAIILCMRHQGRMVEGISDLAGLSKTHPMMAVALTIFMFSMAGIPPLAGFFGKLYVFLAAIEAQLYTLAVIGVVSSVVGAFYYLRIVKLMYFDEPVEILDRPIPREMGAVITISGLFTLLFFLWPAPILNAAAQAAASLFAG
ncbi:MAG: NADH-quinone oxidoreductase subunit NuoN [Alphaproteobacteria bacterium]|nr:NADH-quinone oxidoreductase subunit NuoN [Alphaproteobacteria bacterium]MBU0798387.1 NADH-quinone oxidoreductase subunit NuoN [Alphaproteobacteria bacterium]MBU0887798.1 NADH-quinone oxidoreductase subunit NuoN [Alphaproteobacteria bacterium]MBU1814979.1 NADH-quinone oxidoreductase subunit NuoN [Alphaproteobacteria bacterium]MBU2092223.1 NADH-quinone oxidoreductase subunit NuoN [Alphaproteobacteria bacterium]